MRRTLRRLGGLARRHGVDAAVLALQIGAIATAYVVTGNALVTGAAAVLAASARWVVTVIRTELAHRAREKAEARAEPIRIGSIMGVAEAALALIRGRIVYRDVASAQPRQARIGILEIARGMDLEGGWNPMESDAVREGIARLRRDYVATIGAPVHELGLNERADVHDITALLENAEDALDRVTAAANELIGVAVFERDAKTSVHADAVAEVRTLLRAVVTHAEQLFRAEQIAKGQIPEAVKRP